MRKTITDYETVEIEREIVTCDLCDDTIENDDHEAPQPPRIEYEGHSRSGSKPVNVSGEWELHPECFEKVIGQDLDAVPTTPTSNESPDTILGIERYSVWKSMVLVAVCLLGTGIFLTIMDSTTHSVSQTVINTTIWISLLLGLVALLTH